MAQVASKTCEICVSASGSQYCIECEQYFCENCKIFHKRQKLSKNHQFQSSADDIPEAKSKCKNHNEDVSLLCNTCNVVVCSKCVTGNHKGHAFSQLMDSITQLKEKTKKDVRRKVQEATIYMKKIEDGLQAFDLKIEVVVKAITEEGTKIKAMVDKYIEQMITSVRNQSMMEKDKLAKTMAGYNIVLKSGIHLDKKIQELDKKLNEGKLLQSLQLITDDIAKLKIAPIPEFPSIQYTAKSVKDNDIKQLFGIIETSDACTRQTAPREQELLKPKSEYKEIIQTKDQGKFLFKCGKCGKEESTDNPL